MVNEDRVKKKLPTILVDGNLSKRQNFNDYQLKRYKIRRLEKKNKRMFNQHFRRVVKVLEEFEKALENFEFEF